MNKPILSKVYSQINFKKSYYISFVILFIGCTYCFLPSENNQKDDSYHQIEELFLDSNIGCNFEEDIFNNKSVSDKSIEYNNIGYELFISGDKEGALNFFQKAKNEDPNNPVALSNYALVSGSQSALYDVCAIDTQYGAKISVINAENKLMQGIENKRINEIW